MIEGTASHERVGPILFDEASRRELGFTWFVPLDDDAPAVVRGSLDLVGRRAGGASPEIIDYKSNDAAGREEAVARDYALQRDVYLAAFAELAGVPPGAFSFFFARSGTPIPTHPARGPVDRAAIREATARVTDALRRLRADASRHDLPAE